MLALYISWCVYACVYIYLYNICILCALYSLYISFTALSWLVLQSFVLGLTFNFRQFAFTSDLYIMPSSCCLQLLKLLITLFSSFRLISHAILLFQTSHLALSSKLFYFCPLCCRCSSIIT